MIINNKRYRISFLIFFVLFIVGAFIFRLAQLQIVQGEHYNQLAENNIVQKISTTAPRGNIYTQDGYELAKNKIGYSVELTYTKTDAEQQNKMLLTLYNILEKQGEEFQDEFPILMDKGSFIFKYEVDEKQWKKDNGISQKATAKEALDILRNKFNVKEEVNDEVAIEAIESIHMNANLPIQVSNGQVIFSYVNQEIQWKKDNGFDEKKGELEFDAAQSFLKMRDKYEITDEYSDEDARKILVFRQIIIAQGYRSWEPIEIAANVSYDTVTEIDSMIQNLPGIVITAKPVRVYPYNDLASHVIGYIGKVSESDVEGEDSKYKMTDLKGISGIESSFESYLKGTDGEQFAVTDYKGRPQDDPTQNTIDPIPGNNVHLTLDYDLQKVAQDALETQIKEISKDKSKAPKAASGAVVVLDVNTGAVKAMASYPDYNLNLFSTGITPEDWRKLNILVEDPLYPRPLYNNATLSALQPGSTFKPFMAISALQVGTLTENTTYYCAGIDPVVKKKCLGTHGTENVVRGLRDSCNVFFYQTGLHLGIDNISKYATQFGFGSRTGIEISESAGSIASTADKKLSYAYSASNYIRDKIGIEGNAQIVNDEGKTVEVYKSYSIAKELFDNVKPEEYDFPNEYYKTELPHISQLVSKYNIVDSSDINVLANLIWMGRWTKSDTADASIGQGSNSVTPLQLANYIATLVNGGTHRETYLVDKVVSADGKTVYQHEDTVLNKIDIDSKNLALVKEGMRQVMLNGSGRSGFAGFDHQGIGVGGKTGTAQYGSESVANTAWFTAFTPFEKPEIVVVAMIIQGNKSAYSVPVARKVVDAYYYNNSTYEERQKKEDQQQND